MITKRRMTRGFAALAVVGLLGACSSGDDDEGSGSSDEDVQSEAFDGLVAYAECMRDNGVPMEDPERDSNGNFTIEPPEDVALATQEAAETACQELFDAATPPRPERDAADEAEMQDAQIAAAGCMREKGYDFPDPEFSSAGEPQGEPPAGSKEGDPGFEEFRADMEECLEDAGVEESTPEDGT